MNGSGVRTVRRKMRRGAALVVTLMTLAACGAEVKYAYPENRGTDKDAPVYSDEKQDPGLFGGDGLTLLGKGKREGDGGGGGIGVNSYLWRASLDTIAFMPLSSADPFGGVIITDWYALPETPDERFKLNVYILGRQLRADGVRVAVFRQSRGGAGQWVDAGVNANTNTHMENQILTRARQLRIATASN